MHALEERIRGLLPVVYEDDRICVVEKPAGIEIGDSPREPGGLSAILAAPAEGRETLEPVNRLSRYESGLIVLAKQRDLVQPLRRLRRLRQWEQEYVVVVENRLRKARVVLQPPSASSASAARRAKPDRSSRGRRKPLRKRVATADPNVTTLVRIHLGDKRTLVRCRTRSETTHGLRAVLRSAGYRALGDVVGLPPNRRKHPSVTCLHLARLTLRLPGWTRPRTFRSDPPEGFRQVTEGERDRTRFLRAGMVRRIPLLREEVTDACRLLSGEAEDVPGLIVERFGPALVIHVQQPLPLTRRQLAQVAHWYRQWLPVRSVCVYHVPRGSSGMKPGDSGVMLRTVLGRKLPDEIIVSENGLRFAVRIRETTAVGLYPSHRENRARVRALAAGREVLNLFAYTCGFSVAAAMGGADRVVSVDLSAAHLEWGKHNFELNGLDPGPHAFLSSDALDYLKRAARRGESFDLIVLDPPTFAHGRRRGKDFSVSRDLAELVTGAVRLLRPNGMMLVSTNYRRMSFDGLRRHIRRGAAGRRIKKMQFVPLPPDYAVDPDHAKSVIVHFA